MSFTIKIGKVTDPDTKVVKSFSEVKSLTGTLKNETSIIDPTILIDCNLGDIADCNYMIIDVFKRKYYIKDIKSISNNLVEISAHVDVLNTYAAQILSNEAIFATSENLWNKYLDNGCRTKLAYEVQSITKFPAGFSNPEFVLIAAGRS